uniref:Dorsal n=1 Tax=Lutzomyia longipalpis TaxID=7200 RepID=A0A0U2GTP7_LUTLO|nr:Dorsal [Lutzomyia longipalpis]
MFGNGEGSSQTGKSTNASHGRPNAYVKITEQPAPKALRFRYECEGRSAGSIPGVHSTPENKTFPSIQVVGFTGRAVVVVSCVTKDRPYKPHPHNLVGKDGCKQGVCTVNINEETMSVTFSNLGIQCVKKKDIEEALRVRQEIKVDPYKTGFSHRDQPSSIDLNSVRLCFQVFVQQDKNSSYVPLPPEVSDPIYDKKAMSDLVICKLSHCSCSVAGGQEMILLCEKVAKEDIQVRFYEEKDAQVVWEAYGDFQHTNVHKQVAISFRTPRYRTLEVDQIVKGFIQLKRPSDGATSDPLPFDYLPLDSGRKTFWSLRQGLNLNKRKTTTSLEETFQQILAADREMFGDKASNGGVEDVVTVDAPIIVETPLEKHVDPPINLEQQQMANDKINEWMKSNEFIEATGQRNEYEREEDKTLNELLDQVAELDEIYTDHQLRQHSLIENELSCLDNSLPKLSGKEESMDIDDIFDDAATYTSLQKAFKNPITIPMDDYPVPPPRPPHSPNFYDQVEPVIINPPAPVIDVSPSKGDRDEGEKLPPLPPKRVKKTPGNTPVHDQQDKENDSSKLFGSDLESGLSSFSNSRRSSTRSLTPRPPSQIIIMKTPEPGQRPTSPATQSNTLPKQKKPGFFSKLFSRRKSKDSTASPSSDRASPNLSREPSLTNFSSSDPNRSSVRSLKVPSATRKTGKPVARSASSVSGKRPHLTPDIIHIPLKGESSNSLNFRSGSGTHLSFPGNDLYERASTVTLNNNDRKTMSALQLADLPLQDGNMELIAIADAQSLRNLCEGQYGVQLDPSVDLTEAEHYALYTSVAPHATQSEFDETSAYYAPVEGVLKHKRPKIENRDMLYRRTQEHNLPRNSQPAPPRQDGNPSPGICMFPGTYRNPQTTPSPQPVSPATPSTPACPVPNTNPPFVHQSPHENYGIDFTGNYPGHFQNPGAFPPAQPPPFQQWNLLSSTKAPPPSQLNNFSHITPAPQGAEPVTQYNGDSATNLVSNLLMDMDSQQLTQLNSAELSGLSLSFLEGASAPEAALAVKQEAAARMQAEQENMTDSFTKLTTDTINEITNLGNMYNRTNN